MKHGAFDDFLQAIEDAGNAIVRMARRGLRQIAVMSLPQLMATCVLLALALSIIPLAFTLFVVFLAVKLVLGSCLVSRRKHAAHTME